MVAKRSKQYRRGKKVTVDGLPFSSIKAAAAHFDVNYGTVLKRLAQGVPSEQAFVSKRPPRKEGVPKPCEILGQKFKSHQERNEYFGLGDRSIDLIEKRLGRGWNEEQAVGIAPPPSRSVDRNGIPKAAQYKSYKEIDGKIYPDAPNGCFRLYVIKNISNDKEYIGITIQDLRSRLRGHISEAFTAKSISKFHRAIRKYGPSKFEISLIRNDAKDYKELAQQEIDEIASRNAIELGYNTGFGGEIGTAKNITIQDKTFPSWTVAADYFGIDPRNFSQRITKLGWSPEEAAGLIQREKYQQVEIKLGLHTFANFKEAAKFYSIDYKTAFARKQGGWTLKQVFGLAPPPNEKQIQKKLTVKGHSFESQAAFARFLDVSPSYITKLRNKRMSYEAIFIKIRGSVAKD